MTHWTKAELESEGNPKWKKLGKRRLRERKRAFIIKALGGRCANPDCGSEEELELDHPNHDRMYKGGITTKSWEFIKNEIIGKRLLCRSCNASWGNQT